MATNEQPKTTNESPDNPPKPTSLGRLKKDGTPYKQLTEEQLAKRAEVLAKGRAIAHERRRQLEASRKEEMTVKPIPQQQPTPAPSPVEKQSKYVEPKIEQEYESEPDTLKVMSIPKKKKKKAGKKIIIMDESDSSSSEEEVIVKRKKSKMKVIKKPDPRPPSPPPAPPAPTPAPKPVAPQLTEKEVEKLRIDKIKKFHEKQKKDKLMASIFS